MIFSLLVILAAVMVLAVAIVWYQPEARHRTFAVGQVWKGTSGFTMEILMVKDGFLDIRRTSPEGWESVSRGYPEKDLRCFIIKNRYRCV